MTTTIQLSDKTLADIARNVAKYPPEQKQSAVMATYLKETLGIGFNETTSCGTFTLKEGECMGACGDSPVMLVNDKQMCSFMSKEKIDALLGKLRAEGKVA